MITELDANIWYVVFLLVATAINFIGYRWNLGILQIMVSIFVVFYTVVIMDTIATAVMPIGVMLILMNIVFTTVTVRGER